MLRGLRPRALLLLLLVLHLLGLLRGSRHRSVLLQRSMQQGSVVGLVVGSSCRQLLGLGKLLKLVQLHGSQRGQMRPTPEERQACFRSPPLQQAEKMHG